MGAFPCQHKCAYLNKVVKYIPTGCFSSLQPQLLRSTLSTCSLLFTLEHWNISQIFQIKDDERDECWFKDSHYIHIFSSKKDFEVEVWQNASIKLLYTPPLRPSSVTQPHCSSMLTHIITLIRVRKDSHISHRTCGCIAKQFLGEMTHSAVVTALS